MNTAIRKSIVLSLLVVGLLVALPATAADTCDASGQKVDQAMGEKFATYDKDGNFLAELPKDALLIGEDILECVTSPALVKVKLSEKRSAWVDRLEVKVSGGKAPPPRRCKTAPVSRTSDTTTPATSGIDPCSS